ncbi:MAG TPA: hypothetical protein VHI52_18845 [Verrucomicrobiae bacterium]|nr:hypothetical protein [Verrucomicrobiae bacterium]HWB08272.1 hypothetical protein [Pirellulales bacterium]
MSRRFQFSLRALLVAMLAVAIFFGGVYVGRRTHEIESQQAFAKRTAELRRLSDEADRSRRQLKAEQKRLARQKK